MNKKPSFLTQCALWTCGFGAFSDGVVVPLAGLIFGEFSDASTFMQNMILSGSSFFAIISAVLTIYLMKKVDLRKLLILGSALFFIGGVCGCFSTGSMFLLITRIIDGLSDGVLSVVAIAAITRIYKDEKEKSIVFGGYNAVSALFGLIVSTLAGIIALKSWRLAFLCNGVSGIGLILILTSVPSMPPEIEDAELSTKGERRKLSGKILLSLLTFCVSAAIVSQVYYLEDFYVAEHGIGGSVESGTLLSILTICNLLSGVAFPFLYAKLKKIFKSFILLLSAAALIILYYTYSYIGAAIGIGLAGFMNGLCAVYYSMLVSEESPAEDLGLYAALYTLVMYFQGFIAPYIPGVWNIFTKGESISGTFIYSGVFCLILAVIFLLTKRRKVN